MRSALASIIERAGLGEALDRLDALAPNEVQSALLTAFDRLAARTPAHRMLQKYESNLRA